MIDEAEIRRRALAALRGLAVGDAMGAAAEGYQPAEIEEVYEAPIAELLDPVNLYPESAPDRVRGAIGPVTESALAIIPFLESDGRPNPPPVEVSWAVALGIVTPVASLDHVVAAIPQNEAKAVVAAIVAAVSAGVGGYLARDALALANRATDLAGDPALGQRILQAAGEAQASGGRRVGAFIGADFPPTPGPADAVVFALGVVFGTQSVRRAIPEAVNQGGRASLAAGLAGAITG
ncbi:MAG: hypothetical protein ACRDJ9_20635, partial [Dehalococcoidia bacterium]